MYDAIRQSYELNLSSELQGRREIVRVGATGHCANVGATTECWMICGWYPDKIMLEDDALFLAFPVWIATGMQLNFPRSSS